VFAEFGASHTIDVTNLALLALRCSIGGMILAHGLNKFFGGGKIPGTAKWFESIGMRPGRLNALAAATTEVGSGVLLILGLLTPFAAAGLIGVMVVAIVTVHRKNGYFVFRPGQGIEYCLLVAMVAAVVGALGPGRWSLDYVIGYWHHSRLEGVAIALVLGVGGAVLQLLAVWRPEPVAS
jgi:putative oxidoreductase